MIRSRQDFYGPGTPAPHGQHYRAFVRFALKHAGKHVLDLGCGYGAYGAALAGAGLQCVGCDINPVYLLQAVQHGLPATVVDSNLPFADRTFDSVLLLEVIEHVPNLKRILAEAFRVARKNVLITVPNSENIELLKDNDVTYAHMLSSDHVNFFDEETLRSLLQPYASRVVVERSDPIYPYWFIAKSIPYYLLRLIFRSGMLKPRFYSRLYAVASVRQN